jgi:thiazole synthase ThiGH ThiG subunit
MLTLYGKSFTSRLLLGTAQYPDMASPSTPVAGTPFFKIERVS